MIITILTVFKTYSSITLCTSTLLCRHYHRLQNFLSSPIETMSSLLPHPLSSWQPSHCEFASSRDLLRGTIQSVFQDWLIPLGRMSSRFIHAVVYVRMLFLLKTEIVFHCMYILCFVYPCPYSNNIHCLSTNGHSGCFRLLPLCITLL